MFLSCAYPMGPSPAIWAISTRDEGSSSWRSYQRRCSSVEIGTDGEKRYRLILGSLRNPRRNSKCSRSRGTSNNSPSLIDYLDDALDVVVGEQRVERQRHEVL